MATKPGPGISGKTLNVNLTPTVRATIRAEAHHFATYGEARDLPLALRDALQAHPALRQWAWGDDAETTVARREAWAKEIGALFAETIRTAFREAERSVTEERREAVRFEDALRQGAIKVVV